MFQFVRTPLFLGTIHRFRENFIHDDIGFVAFPTFSKSLSVVSFSVVDLSRVFVTVKIIRRNLQEADCLSIT
jgi:hypothetical protein